MDTFIDQLMGKMTLDEKIGQLNLSGGGVPGILSGSEGADETIRRGWLGATGGSELETFRKLQEIAVRISLRNSAFVRTGCDSWISYDLPDPIGFVL